MSSKSNRKYVIVVPDGMADQPVQELGGRTPLEAAETPWMDKTASRGILGVARTVPQGLEPGSDIANLSILGYSPLEVYTGRAPLEAASMGIELKENDVAFRLNLVTLDRNYTFMADHSADHISTAEARDLVQALAPRVESFGISLFSGVSYRNLLVWHNGPDGCVTHAPHDFPGAFLEHQWPSGQGADVLLRIIIKSWKVFGDHPVNLRRIKQGLRPANSVWPWGQGRAPKMKSFREKFSITGSVVAAVDLIKGIGNYAGLQAIDVPGATGFIDTNYEGKVAAALNSLKEKDFVFLHVEAPDEASHAGDLSLKKRAIEDFDSKVLGPLLNGLGAFRTWRLLLIPDHATPVALRTHSSDPVPFILLDSERWDPAEMNSEIPFTEQSARGSGTLIDDASLLMEMLLNKERGR